jgi:hypothetical protein
VKMGPIRRPETSVNNYHMTPRNIPEERRYDIKVLGINCHSCEFKSDAEVAIFLVTCRMAVVPQTSRRNAANKWT